jgi:hypothetical protein
VITVYAVVGGKDLDAMGRELDSRALRGVHFGELAAIVGDAGEDASVVTEERLWEHEQTVESLMRHGDVLPVRFGAVLGGEESVAELLEGREQELSAALGAIAGRVELAVRARFSAEPAAVPEEPRKAQEPGAAYMSSLLQRRRAAEELVGRIDRELAELASASRARTLPLPTQPMTGAYLVDRGAVERFRARVRELDAEIAEAEIVCTGPWPPYSFAGPREEAA